MKAIAPPIVHEGREEVVTPLAEVNETVVSEEHLLEEAITNDTDADTEGR